MPWTEYTGPQFSGAVVFENLPSRNTPINAANLLAVQQSAAAHGDDVGKAITDWIKENIPDPASIGGGLDAMTMVMPSGGDDTAAINSAIANGNMLGPGTFKVSGVIEGWPLGVNPKLTILQATAAAARIVAGAENGQGPVEDIGTYGNFKFDGMDIAGGSAPLVTANTVGSFIFPIKVVNSQGDCLVVCGQNCTFINPVASNARNCSFVLDNTCGGNIFHNFEFTSAVEYHMEFRQSTPPVATGYTVPTENKFYSGRTEYGFTNDGQDVNTGPNAGALRHRAGTYNRLDHVLFDKPHPGGSLIYFEPNPAGRDTDYNGGLQLIDCGFYGSADSGISCAPGPLLGDYAAYLSGHTIISGPRVGISWASTNPVVDEGIHTLYGVSTWYEQLTGGASLDYWMKYAALTALPAGLQDLQTYFATWPAAQGIDRNGRAQLRGGLAATAAFAANTVLCQVPQQVAGKVVTIPSVIINVGAGTVAGPTYITLSGHDLKIADALAAGQGILLDTPPYTLVGT